MVHFEDGSEEKESVGYQCALRAWSWRPAWFDREPGPGRLSELH